MKNETKGITLVVLVITIVILLILATISIQALTQTGLFESANKAKLESKRGHISETLELKKMLEQTNNPKGTAEEIITATRNNLIQNKTELEKIGKDVNVEDISTEEDGEKVDVYFYVVVDKDVYKVDMSESKFIGELGKLLPVIKINSITNTTNSITVEVKTSRNEGGKIEYYIKSEDEEKYELKETKTDDSEYTYRDLIQGKKYNIKVIARAENGQTAEVTAEQTTGSIANLTAGDIIFTYTVNGKVIDKSTWTNGVVKVNAKINPEIDMTGLKIQTSKDGKKYENTDTQTFTENGTMYVILTDGKNYGGSAGGTVTNIDTTKPIITEATTTTNSVSIKATDEGSGIVGYVIKTNSVQPKNEEYTSVNNKKEFSITINNQIQGTTYYAWVRDQAGNVSEVKTLKTENVTDLIKDANLTFSYSTTGWTNGDVIVTANTTISGYTLQTSTNGQDWTNIATRTYSNNGQIYARLTDGTNYGGVATGSITNIDKTAPTVPTITYNSGSNECKWENNINITLASTDTQSGIAYLQVDWDGDGISNQNVNANFIPGNGYHSCNNRFRAVDNVGNASEWTSAVHIHMDTEKPTHTNWWWGEVNASVARLYIQATDNASGIARVTAPTSTQSGGYNNWVWFDAVWDAGANAYRADITPSTFRHYEQTYSTHLYIWDNAGNGGYYNLTSVNIPSNINYGTTIQSNYGTLYTTDYPTGNVPKSGNDQYNAGNYDRGYYLLTQTPSELISQNTSGKGYALVNGGDNRYGLTEQVANRWIGIHFHGTEYTSQMNISNLRIYFSNNASFTVREAVANGYIEPLVICESMHPYAQFTIWTNILNILDGNATSTNDFPDGILMFKVKGKAMMSAISFYTNKNWSTDYADGLRIYKYYDGFGISTQPIP